MTQIKDDKFITDLGKIIANSDINTSDKKIAKAQYDKSYNAVILGVNWDFTEDVTEKEQTELKNKYSIPEVPDKDNFYTFKINGNYYVKSSNTSFKLYENVKIRVPNGNWDNMYIEVQRDTVNEATGGDVKWFVSSSEPKEGQNDGDIWIQLREQIAEDGTYITSLSPSSMYEWNDDNSEWELKCSFIGELILQKGAVNLAGGNPVSRISDYGKFSVSEGQYTYSTGSFSHAEGQYTQSSGTYAHGEGYGCVAAGVAAHAEGYQCTTGNSYDARGAHAEGISSIAIGMSCHAEGSSAKAIGTASHAEGMSNESVGNSSHAEGFATKSMGGYSHAEGWATESIGTASHAEGLYSNSSGEYSHAEGWLTKSIGIASHAEGTQTIAEGDYSHSGGINSCVNGYCGFAHGDSLIAGGHQTVFGTCNQESPDSLVIVGCGIPSAVDETEYRSNALELSSSYNLWIRGTYQTQGKDYSEYYEWEDGNEEKEDRRGLFVTINNHKIVKANSKDNYILGVISSTPSIIGDAADNEWKGRFKRDIFECYVKDSNGKLVESEEYNPDEEYIPRSQRSEYEPVGTHGKLIVVDDGTCEVNGYCGVGENGIGIKCDDMEKVYRGLAFRVIERLDDTHIRIIIK